MIVTIVGKVKYSITLDPTVWIFDSRKVPLDEAFKEKKAEKQQEKSEAEKAMERWNREVYQQKYPNINDNVEKNLSKEVLKNSYVMPLKDFIQNAEITEDAAAAYLLTKDEHKTKITLKALKEGYLLFAKDGKPLREDGPVHFYYGDGSNKDEPIKNINKIMIV